jgi:hypothetical protein
MARALTLLAAAVVASLILPAQVLAMIGAGNIAA